jgi:heterotetrameric sarcosine oxidase gamma subunit
VSDRVSEQASEPVLTARSCLAGVATLGRYGRSGTVGVTLGEVTGIALASVSTRSGQFAPLSAAIEQRFGTPLPVRPVRLAHGAHAFIWSGPEQWRAVSREGGDLAGHLAACAGELASVTDLTGSRAVIEVSGPHARDGLMKLLPVDLHPRVFAVGDTALTLAAHISVQVWQADATPTYVLACPRSFGCSLWAAVTAAVAEYGYSVA